MNDPSNLGADAFAQTFHYFSGDYQSRNHTTGLPENSTVVNANQYTGNIAGLTWQSKNTQGGDNPLATFGYTYDNQYQLKRASNGTNNFLVDNLRYDANGNILSLRRRDKDGNFLHQFGYKYDNEGTNQLTSIPTNNLAFPAIPGYVKAYKYDAIGQMTYQELESGQITQTVYDVSGKVEEIRDENNQLRLIYDYDDRGFRIRKKDVTSDRETIYVRDASGQLMSTYIQDVGQTDYLQEETPVYGGARLGFWKHQSGLTEYELKDHLGNVRSKVMSNEGVYNIEIDGPITVNQVNDNFTFSHSLVSTNTDETYFWSTVSLETYVREIDSQLGSLIYVISEESTVTRQARNGSFYLLKKSTNTTTVDEGELLGTDGIVYIQAGSFTSTTPEEVTYFADYYPFGEVMQEGVVGQKGRYGYQGDFAEKDEETGWNHFELREYDAAVGRWLSVDPYGEFYSPYNGMGNDPINRWDPTGGCTGKCKEEAIALGINPASLVNESTVSADRLLPQSIFERAILSGARHNGRTIPVHLNDLELERMAIASGRNLRKNLSKMAAIPIASTMAAIILSPALAELSPEYAINTGKNLLFEYGTQVLNTGSFGKEAVLEMDILDITTGSRFSENPYLALTSGLADFKLSDGFTTTFAFDRHSKFHKNFAKSVSDGIINAHIGFISNTLPLPAEAGLEVIGGLGVERLGDSLEDFFTRGQ